MSATDGPWILKVSKGTPGIGGTKTLAVMADVNGEDFMKLMPARPTSGPSDASAIDAEFEAAARMASAAPELHDILQELIEMAIDAGVPQNAALVTKAREAITKAKPPVFDVLKDDDTLFSGPRDGCWAFVRKHSGMSYDEATQVGGYRIRSAGLRPLADDNTPRSSMR